MSIKIKKIELTKSDWNIFFFSTALLGITNQLLTVNIALPIVLLILALLLKNKYLTISTSLSIIFTTLIEIFEEIVKTSVSLTIKEGLSSLVILNSLLILTFILFNNYEDKVTNFRKKITFLLKTFVICFFVFILAGFQADILSLGENSIGNSFVAFFFVLINYLTIYRFRKLEEDLIILNANNAPEKESKVVSFFNSFGVVGFLSLAFFIDMNVLKQIFIDKNISSEFLEIASLAISILLFFVFLIKTFVNIDESKGEKIFPFISILQVILLSVISFILSPINSVYFLILSALFSALLFNKINSKKFIIVVSLLLFTPFIGLNNSIINEIYKNHQEEQLLTTLRRTESTYHKMKENNNPITITLTEENPIVVNENFYIELHRRSISSVVLSFNKINADEQNKSFEYLRKNSLTTYNPSIFEVITRKDWVAYEDYSENILIELENIVYNKKTNEIKQVEVSIYLR